MRGEAQADTQGEIGAIFARLKDEVRNRPAERARAASESPSYVPPAMRLRAERAWSVTAERPFQNPPEQGLPRRYLAAPVKRVLRKLMRWYVEPLAADQRSFNLAILALVDELAERAHADVRRLERRLEALEERLAAGDAARSE